MKTYTLLFFFCFCLYESCQAQIYLKGYTGYAFSTGNEKLTSTEMLNGSEYTSSYHPKFGQGVNLGLSMGYTLTKNVAFELTGNTQLFSKYKYSHPYQWDFTYDPEKSYSWSSEGFFGNLEYSYTLFQFSPQVVFKSNPYKQWTFYLKGGPDFLLVKHKETNQTIALNFPGSNAYVPSYLTTTKYSGNINTGIQCSFGTEYKLSKTICVFAELTMVDVKCAFNRGQILRYEIDGKNSLSELESKKLNDLDYKLIFNHLGLNVGIKYSLEKKNKKIQ